jgi:ABC-2 type transport system permease protein
VIRDAWLIVVKEYREVLLRMGSLKANVLNLGLILLVFGVVMPLQAGPLWVSRWWMLFTWTWLPLFLVSALVADSFAGERERHTLETLLASRLSDRAILFGKLSAAVLYGWGVLMVVMLVSLITVNLRFGSFARPLLFPAGITVGVMIFGLLITLLIGGIGVMVSLKAQTVRQAGQALSLGLIAVLWLPGLAIGLVFSRLPEAAQDAVIVWAGALNGSTVAIWAAIALAALDATIVLVAARRFKRSRLVFD